MASVLQKSFNFYPIHQDAELRLLSGRYNGNGITSLGAHWGVVFMEQSNSTSVGEEWKAETLISDSTLAYNQKGNNAKIPGIAATVVKQ